MSIQIQKQDFQDSFLRKLLEIPDCPQSLFIEGNLNNISKKTKFIAVVGSRRHSSYAKEALEKIISDLQGYNIVIISGLALGIDSLAHRFAIKYNLKTIAIPGSGLSQKVLYPKTNLNLSKQILDQKGLLISEYENEFKATP